jgi:photosystem II stability/assembly factor-like uncharacterized protein
LVFQFCFFYPKSIISGETENKSESERKIVKQILLTVLAAGLVFANLNLGAQTWVETIAPNQHWQSIAVSANGSNVVAVADNNNGNIGVIYTSTNSGTTWTSNNVPNLTWNCVASSENGNYLAANSYGGQIYTSTNAGNNWTESRTTGGLYAIASSADGTRLFAGGGLPLYISTNAGNTWTTEESAPFSECSSIACSANGSNLIAGTYGDGNVYTSTNSGASWTLATNVGVNPSQWVSVASSADGTILTAMGTSVYVSTNGGDNWTLSTSAPQDSTNSAFVASSADGRLLAASPVSPYDGVYVSTNFGVTWNASGPPPNGGSLACSGNGGVLLSSVYGGGIWTTEFPVVGPTLSLLKAVEPQFSNLIIGENYQLQVSGNLTTWTNQGTPFIATNSIVTYPQYFNVSDWNQLFFRLVPE